MGVCLYILVIKMRGLSKVRMIAGLFLVTILLTGSLTVYFIESGILIALAVFVILFMLTLLIAVAILARKKSRFTLKCAQAEWQSL
jgi:hypothetical protein